MRYIIIFSYDGSAFNGFQKQPSAPSVQETVEKALTTLLHEEISIVGAGRTDTGVNAIDYVAHFDFSGSVLCDNIVYKLNAILPAAIAVSSVEAVSEDFHARFSALKRTYRYFFHYGKDPFAGKYSYRLHRPVDISAMARAAALLVGTYDFSCFEKVGGSNKTSVCTVYEAKFGVPRHSEPVEESQILRAKASQDDANRHSEPVGGSRHSDAESAGRSEESHAPSAFYFEITANRFLRNMVRAIVGTLLEIGLGKKDPEWILEVIASKDRGCSGESVPGEALFLVGIEY